MQSLRDYIIKSDTDFNETFTTEGGVQLYASKRFTGEKLSNKIVTVVSTPLLADEEVLQAGYQIAIDPTCYYQQNYNTTGDQDGPMVINRREGLYRLDPSMIVLYRENEGAEWKGYGKSLLVEKTTETEKEKTHGAIIVALNETKTRYTVKYSNEGIDIEAGDEIFINKQLAVPYWFDNKEYLWMANEDILAKVG